MNLRNEMRQVQGQIVRFAKEFIERQNAVGRIDGMDGLVYDDQYPVLIVSDEDGVPVEALPVLTYEGSGRDGDGEAVFAVLGDGTSYKFDSESGKLLEWRTKTRAGSNLELVETWPGTESSSRYSCELIMTRELSREVINYGDVDREKLGMYGWIRDRLEWQVENMKPAVGLI